MTPLQRTFVWAVFCGGVITLVALLRRGRYRECWTYFAYLIALTAWGGCLATWPGRFYRWDWWMAKQAVFDVLKVGIAIELTYRALRSFPGARARVQVAMLGVLIASAAIISSGPPHARVEALWTWQPQIKTAIIWLFGVTAFGVIFYRLPVSDWHRAVVLAFTVRLFIATVLLNMLSHFGFGARPWYNTLDGAFDVAVSWTLAWAAWRPAQADVFSPDLRRRIAEATAAATAAAATAAAATV